MKFDLVCLGHVLYDIRCYVDSFPLPDKLSIMAGRLKHSGGGSAANVAVNSTKLGLKTGMIGKVGFDEYGWVVVQNFRNWGVNTDYILVDFKNPTGVSLIIVNGKGIPEFIQMIGASDPILPEEIQADYIQKARNLHMSGTNIEALTHASKIAKDSGITVSFDSGRKKSELGFKKLRPVLKNVETLIINRHEAKVMLDLEGNAKTSDVAKVMRKKIGKDKTYVIKGGKENILVYSPNGDFVVPSFKVAVKDTIGAGDAFDAGFLAAFLRGKSVEDAVVYGAACGSLKCTKEGAQSAPDKSTLEMFLKENRDKVEIWNLRES
ncbi:MAG: carbohydrate kinase family protein [Candidatus Bathyarchaeia archaeon]